jgi:diguanylate cyclase (GGDEF)-like protein
MSKSKVKNMAPSELSGAARLLSSSALFASFSSEELDYLAEKSEFLSLDDGELVFAAGAPGDRLFLVDSGSVLVRSPHDGSTLAELVAGDSFGELEMLTGAPRNAEARASGRTRLLAFPAGGASLKKALSGRPEAAARILRSFLLVVAGRTRKSNALVKENSPWVRELRRQVYGDKLTGLLNKAYLDENLPSLLAASAKGELALVMMKPDNFKDINDSFGHEAGDAALVLMARELDRAVGKDGVAARYMGNELAVAYPGLGRAAALEAARSLQARLGELDLSSAIPQDPGVRLRMSLGIALYPEHGSSAEELIKAAAGLPLEARSRGGSLVLFPEDLR